MPKISGPSENMAICEFSDPFFFAICGFAIGGDTFLQVRKYIISLLINALIRTRTKLKINPNKPVAVFLVVLS